MGKIITGTHEERTGKKIIRDGKEVLEMTTVVDSVPIPDPPEYESDFPEGTIAGRNPKPAAAPQKGLVCLVTVDGQKFYVKPGTRPKAAA